MPNEGFSGPLRPQEAVFTANNIKVTAPQQAIKPLLVCHRQDLQRQITELDLLSGAERLNFAGQ